jgi:hypothetical protein
MERVAQASLAAVSLLTPAPLRAYERRADCRLADATTRATTAKRQMSMGQCGCGG